MSAESPDASLSAPQGHGIDGVTPRVTPRRTAVVLYATVALLYWASLFTYLPTLPTFAATLTPDLALIGTILSMYGLWQAVARLPVGIAADWVGWRKPFVIALLALAAVGASLMGSATTPTQLLIGRSITGIAAAAWVPLTVVFSALFPADQVVRATTLLTVTSAVARVVATAANGPLNAIGGYSLPFTAAAVVAGLGMLLVLPAAEVRRPARAPTMRALAQLARRRDVLLPALLNATVHYVLMGTVFGFVPLLASDLGASGTLVSNLTVVHLAFFTPSVLAAAVLLRHVRPRPLLLVSFVAVALGVACGAVGSSVGWLLAVQALVGIGFGICYPILMGMSIEHVDTAQRTTAMGLHQSVYALGMFAGPWLSGILAARLGIRPMFALTALACLVVGVVGSLRATRRESSR